MVLKLNRVDEPAVIPVNEHKSWYAWINFQPPGPTRLHVIGDVTVPNPGVDALLVERYPQGFNPTILQLEFILVQKPGHWPAVVVQKQVRFEKIVQVGQDKFRSVEIFSNGDSTPIVAMPVDEVH